MRTLELLAPARDLSCGMTAVNCGADAVYIGADKFGAREAASNNLESIERLIRHAHSYWVRVYVTLNTLLRDEEIAHAEWMAWQLHELGVDGLIIQDMGLLERQIPPIPLIASTQAHNSTPEKVKFLQDVGFQRAILARELDLDQIRAIRKAAPDIELEAFVHGALCVSYSGQCYLSYSLGGRSGNRGCCAQPCRNTYALSDEHGRTVASKKYVLNLHDLNLSEHIETMIDAGISAFKIEGRLKDETYVANVTAHYHRRLDEAAATLGLQRASSGSVHLDFTPDLAKTFNRGYTTHFLNGRTASPGALDTPKMRGEPVGFVLRVQGDYVVLDRPADLQSGDGLTYFDGKGNLRGAFINGVEDRTIHLQKPSGIEPGAELYRNHDHEFLKKLRKTRTARLLGVRFTLTAHPTGIMLYACDEDGVRAAYSVACEMEPAQNPVAAAETIRKQLAKTGDTPFECVAVSIEIAPIPFITVGMLNSLRRSTLEQLVKIRQERRPRFPVAFEVNEYPFPLSDLSFEANILNRSAEKFYMRHGVTRLVPAAESGVDLLGRRVMTTRYCVRQQFGLCPRDNANATPEPMRITDANGNRLRLEFNCRECQMHVILEARGENAHSEGEILS